MRVSLFRNIFRCGAEKPTQQKHSILSILRHSNILSQISFLKYRHVWRKRVILNRGRKETPSCASAGLPGSYTIEAAVVMPIFVGVIAVFFFFFQIMEVQWKIQRAVENTSRLFAITAGQQTEEIISAGTAVYLMSQLKKSSDSFSVVKGGISGIFCLPDSRADNYVDVEVLYTVEVPIRFFGKLEWTMIQKARNRKWIGYDPAEDGQADSYVYITPYGKVCHKSSKCPYLDLSVQSVPASEIDGLRNRDGSRYVWCSRCEKRISVSDTVYVTDYGETCHRALDCAGLKRTVYRVRRDTVKQYPLCDKCGG